jgi:transcriptional regulator with XRE-family HTH domain
VYTDQSTAEKSDVASDLGKLLRRARQKKEMGLRELARKINKSPALLTRLENEDQPPAVSPETLVLIANALDLEVDQLFVRAQRAPDELSPQTELEFALYRKVKDLKVAEQTKLLEYLKERPSKPKKS